MDERTFLKTPQNVSDRKAPENRFQASKKILSKNARRYRALLLPNREKRIHEERTVLDGIRGNEVSSPEGIRWSDNKFDSEVRRSRNSEFLFIY